MAEKLIIPIVVLAHRLKSSVQVPALNPNYKTALASYLGKDSTPAAFNKDILLKSGVHLHFVLPSAMKNGTEVKDENGNTTFDYPAVPDRFTITRMYVSNGKIHTDSNIIESNFYSLDSSYSDSITIPKFDDLRQRHRYRYLGRTYSAAKPAPEPLGEYGYFDKITAVGAGDPMFNAYYPSCQGVFGYYDSLENVPGDAVLTYFVTGVYSNPNNDILAEVKTGEDMKSVLARLGLSADDEVICSSSVLFGEVGGIKLSEDEPPATGEINVGIGKSSAEALSAIIAGKYYSAKGIERFITSIQYDTADEVSQPDGNFKIDDDIHLRGFSELDPIEAAYGVRLPQNADKEKLDSCSKAYSELCLAEREIGKQRRLLEYRKKSLYCIWEMYMAASDERQKLLITYMNPLVDEISSLRSEIAQKISAEANKRKALDSALAEIKAELERISPGSFYYPKDPSIMLFGSGMTRTYAFGEDGRFEADNTLFCLKEPLSSDIPPEEILSFFDDNNSPTALDSSRAYAVMAVILDSANILPRLMLEPAIEQKFSPVMYNDNPTENVTLLMQWETAFYPDYSDSNPQKSSFEYSDTDYTYSGPVSKKLMNCSGVSVLTPQGVYNLQEKLKKYLENHSESEETAEIVKKIKDIAAVSQNLGGFNLSLDALKYTFQFPIDIDPHDIFSKKVSECLEPSNAKFYEPPLEREAVMDNSEVFPLREGFLGLTKLAIVSSFGEQRLLIDDNLMFKGAKYFSESLFPIKNGLCFLPLNLTSAARLSVNFVTAENNTLPCSAFPQATPVIGIFLPDMLNRNLNVFDSSGVLIGVIKTAYRYIGGNKKPVGRFVKAPDSPANTDKRITAFISELTKDNSAFYEVMNAIDAKLSKTASDDNFDFGRLLVLAEASAELEFFGGTEWSKKDGDVGAYNDKGLSERHFPIMFGDKERITDGLCCGFYGGFEKGFAPFGEAFGGSYLNAEPFSLSSADGVKNITLLFDPSLSVTVSTGILPVIKIKIPAPHNDFSEIPLVSAELNTLISGDKQIQLPPLSEDCKFSRLYPVLSGGVTEYGSLEIVSPTAEVNPANSAIITDGIIVAKANN